MSTSAGGVTGAAGRAPVTPPTRWGLGAAARPSRRGSPTDRAPGAVAWGRLPPPGRRSPPGRGAADGPWSDNTRGQHSLGGYLLTVNLSSIHMFNRLLRIVSLFILYICKAPIKFRMSSVFQHFNVFNSSIHSEYFHDVFFVHIASKPSNVDFGRARDWASLPTTRRLGLGPGSFPGRRTFAIFGTG